MLATQTLDKLQALRLEGMAQALTEQRQQNDLAAVSFEDRLALLVERQWLWRENRGLAIRLKNAQLKISASLEDLDYRSSRGLKRAQIEQLRQASALTTPASADLSGQSLTLELPENGLAVIELR